MSAEGLERSGCFAVGNIDLIVACSTRNEQRASIGEVFDEAHITYCAIMHRQLRLASVVHRAIVLIEASQLHL